MRIINKYKYLNYFKNMDIRLKKIIKSIGIFCFFVFTASTCDTCKNCEGDDKIVILEFESKYSIIPEKVSYKLGDTMVFESRLGTDLSHKTLSSQITCRLLEDTDSTTFPYAAKKFDAFFIQGKQINIGELPERNIVNFAWRLIGDEYVVEIGLIPRDTGSYFYIPFSAGLTINEGSDCETRYTFSILNGNTDNHYHLYTDIIEPPYGQYQYSGYFFRVIP